jgi:hypothetical protein
VTSDAQIARRQVYEAEVRRAGGPTGAYGYGLLLLGLALSIAGGFLPALSSLRWIGLGVLVPALACFLIVIVNRRRFRRDHPFQG